MDNKNETIFADGVYFDSVNNAKVPWIVARIAIDMTKFNSITHFANARGYLNMNVCRKKSGDGYYVSVDTWRPTKRLSNEEDAKIEAETNIPF